MLLDIKEKVTLGGFPQQIHIKGSDPANPVILFLHGGPGISNRHAVMNQYTVLCDEFTIVAWDQRGTGGSYEGIDVKTLTFDRLIEDGYELCVYLCKKLNRKKIFLVGGSWGSELGTYIAYRHPDVVAAYIGYGQVVNGGLNESISFEYCIKKANEAGDLKSIEILNQVGPPVNGQYNGGFDGMMAQRKILKKYGGHSTKKGGYFKTTVLPMLFSGEYTLKDIVGLVKGYKLVLTEMWQYVADTDFIKECNQFKMPYYIFQGRLDNNTPSSLVQGYFDIIEAPEKELVWFEHSAHGPISEEREKFMALLRERFRKIES